VALGAGLQVGQAAAARGLRHADAVVDDVEGEHLVDGDVDLRGRGPRVPGDVAQGLAQDRDEVVGDVVGDDGVQRAGEPGGRGEPQRRRDVGEHVEHAAAQVGLRAARDVLELEDRGADLGDGVVEIADGPDDPVTRHRPGPQDLRDALQRQARGEEPLDDVVVQVGGDAVAVVEHRGTLLLGAGAGELQGEGGLVGEAGAHVEVVVGERGPVADPGGDQHAVDLSRADQRHDQHGVQRELGGHGGPEARSTPGPGVAHRRTGAQHPSAQRALHRDDHPDHGPGTGAHGDLDEQIGPVVGRPGQRDEIGFRHLSRLLDDQSERVTGLVGQEPAGDRRRGPQPVLAAPGDVVEPGVRDRDPRRRGERLDELLVLGAELAVRALAEVEVAEDLPADPDRDPEEAVHRRVPVGEARRPRVVGDTARPDRYGLVDEGTEQALALREVGDPGHRRRRHADVHELRETARPVGDTEGGVARPDQLAGRLDDVAQQHREGEVAADHLVGAQQTPQPALGGEHLVGPRDQLAEQVVELEAGQVGEGHQGVGPNHRRTARSRRVGGDRRVRGSAPTLRRSVPPGHPRAVAVGTGGGRRARGRGPCATDRAVSRRAASGGATSDGECVMDVQHAATVVVGVDGSVRATQAARWAAAEAERRGLSVRLVSAVGGDVAVVPHPELAQPYEEVLVGRAREALGASAAVVARDTPGVRVETVLVSGHPLAVLREQARDALLVVIGDRGWSKVEGLIAGSVSVALATHAECPVVVVRGADDREAPAPVVVGVDGSETSEAAVAFAYEAAATRRVGLVAVYVWSDVFADPLLIPLTDTAAMNDEGRRILAERLAGWAEKYPDVAVERVVVRDRPAHALLAQADRGQLVVVGSRGRGELAGLVLGSVSNTLLHRSPCPVAVVRS
jgi:nucleotide-binding universal stress UspA family protein